MNLNGIRDQPVSLFVNGTLMRGLQLHGNLAGAVFVGVARTAPRYRLFSVRDIHPAMMPAATGDGVAVTGEVYDVALDHLQRVLDGEPPGLGLGVVDLEDGAQCLGILWVSACPPVRAVDISAFGGWREYHVVGGGSLPQAVLVELCGRNLWALQPGTLVERSRKSKVMWPRQIRGLRYDAHQPGRRSET